MSKTYVCDCGARYIHPDQLIYCASNRHWQPEKAEPPLASVDAERLGSGITDALVDKAARAAFEHRGGFHDPAGMKFEEFPPPIQERWRTYARAALEAAAVTLSERAHCEREGEVTARWELALVKAALRLVIEQKAPAYHDCIDAGEPECAWCIARAALASSPPPSSDITPEKIREQVWQGKIVGADCSSGDTIIHLDCLVPVAVNSEYALVRITPPTRNSQEDNEGERG